MNLKGKVVIVTGSSHGIGKATAKKFLSIGCKVVFVARSKDKLKELEKKFGKEKALYLSLDLTVQENCKKLVQKTKAKFKRIDVLVNNLGIGFRGKFEDTELENFEKVVKVNFLSAVYCTKYALDEIKKVKGSIVFVSSIASLTGIPFYSPYSSSKRAINAFSDSLNLELLKSGVHVGTLVFSPVEIEKGKKIVSAKKVKKYFRKTGWEISLDRASEKIVKSVVKRKRIMYVGFLTKLLLLMTVVSPWLVRRFFKNFECPVC